MRALKISVLLIVLSGLLFLLGNWWYNNHAKRPDSVIFSPKTMLSGLWHNYKNYYIEQASGRTLDRQQNDITTSEGQSYTLLRSVWLDDKATFDKSWNWTKDNLQRNDSLFAWKFGQLSTERYGILVNEGGQNTATDADIDISLALIFAWSRWQEEEYLEEAQKIILSIWEEEVVVINSKPYLVANNLEQASQRTILINPSYFAPYAYRIFASIDKGHDWPGLVDTSYELLQTVSAHALNASATAGLPPDWFTIKRANASIAPEALPTNLTTNFSYDAMRIPWRLYLDWLWFKEERAVEVLKKFEFLSREWTRNQAIYSRYSHSGEVLSKTEAPAIYGASLAYFMATDKETAEEIVKEKLHALYSPDTADWKERLNYYDDNWAWFGLALFHGQLINLYEGF
jgi:endoglucanase